MEQVEIARWRLTGAHYINGHFPEAEKNEWEYQEMSPQGRAIRKRHVVPMFLDPKDPTTWNYPGEIIVSTAPNAADIVITGPPTMEMEPLNAAAKALSEKEAPKWNHPIDSLPGQGGFADHLIVNFNRQIEALLAKGSAQPAAPVPVSAVSTEDFAKLQQQMTELAEQNAQLMAKMAEKEAEPKRRSA